MLRTLKDLFATVLSPPDLATRLGMPGPERGGASAAAMSDEHHLQLATAVLLVEVMRASGDTSAEERLAVLAALRRKFELSDDEIDRLVELAEHTQRQATDFHAFTSALNERLDHAHKVRVIEAMWQVAYADGHLAAHENHVLWRIADLLHVPQAAYINAKIRAKAAAGL